MPPRKRFDQMLSPTAVSTEMHAEIQALARIRDCYVTDIIRDALEAFLKGMTDEERSELDRALQENGATAHDG